jgi:deazaflavin-dependent oxidoreductase (nitroreductase family)
VIYPPTLPNGILMTSTNPRRDEKAIDDAFRTRSGNHAARYIATNGERGYDDNSHKAPTLLLTTTGRRSGNPYTAPLYFADDVGRFIVIASKGGSDRDPQWYLNLVANPEVGVQIRDEVFRATARTADADEKARLWPLLADQMPFYNAYQERAQRDIPLVILEPIG